MQPDEETGSAEEQPASNMAAPRLETVEYRNRSVWGGFNFTRMAIPLRKPLPSVRKQRLVCCYIRQCPVEGLMVHSHTAHQGQHRLFIRHGGSHSGNPPEVSVESFDPVGCVYHCLYLRGIIEIRHISLVVSVIAKQLYCTVILTPSVAHLLPLFPCHFNGIVALPGAEDVTHISRKSCLVSMSHLGKHIAFQVGDTAL